MGMGSKCLTIEFVLCCFLEWLAVLAVLYLPLVSLFSMEGS